MASDARTNLQSPVTNLYGVGPERAALLARLDIRTVGDLLLHRAHRYEDRRNPVPIRDMPLKERVLVRGKVVALGLKTFRKRSQSLFELILEDGTARLHCQWWNLPFMEQYFAQGDEVVVYGRAKSLKPRTFDHPETEVIEPGEELSVHMNRLVPIYPLTEGLPQRWLRGLIWRTLAEYKQAFADVPLNQPIEGLPSRVDAISSIHFPNALGETELARQRLALDEFLLLQLQIQKRRQNLQQNAQALPCGGNNSLIKPFLKRLGFQLTDAQKRVLRELRADMGAKHPMRRLVQGDVGCGKTVVSACCALMAIESGFAVAIMAPTEILAEQHHSNFTDWFEPLGIAVEMHTGARKTRTQSKSNNIPPFVVGTHALIESGFAVENLGLVIIDEQHKFGVTQREKLVRKGRYPHLLVMTATPIPRTLGLTIYGDLDISVIDELPLNRGRIRTFIRSSDTLPQVFQFIRSKLKAGQQAYVVYPRVAETDDGTVKAVLTELEKLRTALAPYKVGVLHGRLPSDEKEQVTEQFRKNQIQVLLATSIVEVGVDVPNATVMLVENSEQFGLAQLHQIRGRVGRGRNESYCVLIDGGKTHEAAQRLRVLERTSDGFEIAEADLKLRGPGELLGQEQSGMPSFRFADLVRDGLLVERARQLAKGLLEKE